MTHSLESARGRESQGSSFVTNEVRELTENGELKRSQETPNGDIVWRLLKGETVIIPYSDTSNITISPDGSGSVSDTQEPSQEINFDKWDTKNMSEYGEGYIIDTIKLAKDFIEKNANAIPHGNLKELGGIKNLVESFLEIRRAEFYGEGNRGGIGKTFGDYKNLPEVD